MAAAAAASGGASRSLYRSTRRASERRNAMVAPSELGDPVTALAVREDLSFVVTGTSLGAVRLWQAAHHLKGNASSLPEVPEGLRVRRSSRKTAEEASSDEPVFPCLEMCARSDEGVFGLYLRDGHVIATVGDVSCKMWKSYRNAGYTLLKFKRTHNHFVCVQSRTLQSGRHVLVSRAGNNEALHVDLDAMRQTPVRFAVPAKAVVSFWDGAHLVVRGRAQDGSTTVTVWDFWNLVELAVVHFPGRGKDYWGFVVDRRRVAYVSARSNLKVLRLRHEAAAPPAADGDGDGDGDGDAGVEAKRGGGADGDEEEVQTEHLTSKSYFAKLRHGADVLAFAFTADGYHIVTLAEDSAVRVWDLASGRDLVTFAGVKGRFRAGHLQHMRLAAGDRSLFYTADDGVFHLDIGDDWH